ncbi:MAG: hypothetical protein AB1473_19270 [Thermodesulfobacteriota bacterium]
MTLGNGYWIRFSNMSGFVPRFAGLNPTYLYSLFDSPLLSMVAALGWRIVHKPGNLR